jgi:hypothetical protein
MYWRVGLIFLILMAAAVPASGLEREERGACSTTSAREQAMAKLLRVAGPLTDGIWADDCCLNDLPCCGKSK